MKMASCHPDRQHKAHGLCRPCYNHENFKRIKDQGYYTPERNRKAWLHKYGLTLSEFDEMLAEQEGKCAICGVLMDKPCIDHDHETKFIRGLLCAKCNYGIGFLAENVEVLQSAIAYLDQAAFIKVLIGGKPIVLQKMMFKPSAPTQGLEVN